MVSMVLRKSADRQSSLEARFARKRFTRRSDLTNSIRLTIAASALHATMNGVWGAISPLADEHEISRPFVYSRADTLKEAAEFFLERW
jgi:putative SOS response-associated peptidase YedK